MPQLPAFCDSCGAVFGSGIEVANSTGLRISNVTIGPCPSCGGTGHVPDGVYDVLANTISLVLEGPTDVATLRRLVDVLQHARNSGTAADALATDIEREVPAHSRLGKVAQQLAGVRLAEWLVLLVMIITLLLAHRDADKAAASAANTDRILEQVMQQLASETPPTPAAPPPATRGPSASGSRSERVGRNDPCPCGSGKKYKHCHLDADRR